MPARTWKQSEAAEDGVTFHLGQRCPRDQCLLKVENVRTLVFNWSSSLKKIMRTVLWSAGFFFLFFFFFNLLLNFKLPKPTLNQAFLNASISWFPSCRVRATCAAFRKDGWTQAPLCFLTPAEPHRAFRMR